MERPDPTPPVPSSGPGASSAVPPNTTPGTTLESTSTSVPAPSDASETRPAGPGSQQAAPPPATTISPASQQVASSPPATMFPAPQQTAPSSVTMVPPTSQQPVPPATSMPSAEQSLTADQSRPRTPSQQPAQFPSSQPMAEQSAPGARPTTGSTLGGPGPEYGLPNPPTPPTARPPLPQIRTARSTSRGITPSVERLEDADTLSGHGLPELHRDSTFRTNQPLPTLPQARLGDNGLPSRRQRTLDSHGSILGHGPPRRSGIDWIVPVDEKRKRTVSERIQPTLDTAITERNKYAAKAKATAWALNAAIGLQVILGSVTTGLSAVGTTGRQTAIQTTIFGALSTIVASYLARARGSNEPELSITRGKDLDQFIREAEAFKLDHGHVDSGEWDREIDRLRRRFEELLGNASGERKLAPPA